MISNFELYGREDVPRVPMHVANFRIALLKENLAVHMNNHYSEWNTYIIKKMLTAISHWEKLRDGEEIE